MAKAHSSRTALSTSSAERRLAGASAASATRRSALNPSAVNQNAGGRAASSRQSSASNASASNAAERQQRSDREQPLPASRESAPASRAIRQAPLGSAFAGYGLSPFSMMRRLVEDMDRLFSGFGAGTAAAPALPLFSDQGNALQRFGNVATAWTPQVDIVQRGDELILRADLPGISKDDVEVEIDNGVLTIHGERHDEFEDEREGVYRSERTYGSFYRAIPLPENADADRAKASFSDGVLEISVPAPKRGRGGRQLEIR
jgi:HSP20 family protein